VAEPQVHRQPHRERAQARVEAQDDGPLDLAWQTYDRLDAAIDYGHTPLLIIAVGGGMANCRAAIYRGKSQANQIYSLNRLIAL
jgi:hypothetical protein